MLWFMSVTHSGPRGRTITGRHLRLVPRPDDYLRIKAGDSAAPSSSELATTIPAVDISFAARLLGAAPAEIESLAQLNTSLARNFGSVSSKNLIEWIERLPNAEQLHCTAEHVRENIVKVLQEIARTGALDEPVRLAALNYLRTARAQKLALLVNS